MGKNRDSCDFNWCDALKSIIHYQNDELLCLYIEDGGKIRKAEIDDPLMVKCFDEGYGAAEGCAFCAWGKKNVYFPHEYDGYESINFVRRNPDKWVKNHGSCW